MRKRNFLDLLFVMMIAAATLFAATGAWAACTPEETTAASCFVAGGFEVRTAGTFPVQNNDGSTSFIYTVTPLPGTTKNVSTIDMLVPVCNADFNLDGVIDNIIQISTGDPNGWRSYPPGQGSSNTNYGLGATQYSVFEQSFNSSGPFYLHTSKASAAVTSMALKIGSQLVYGAIQGPACYFPKVASTVEQVIQLDPMIPSRFWTVLKDADGSLLQVLDENNQPLPLKKLSEYPVWVCIDPILDSSGNYQGCNTTFYPLTYMPEGVGRFGKHTCYNYTYLGKACTKCY